MLLSDLSPLQVEIVAENLLQGNHHKPNYDGVPSVVAVPPLASKGLQEHAARLLGLSFRMNQGDTSSWRVAEPSTRFKVMVEELSERILGAHRSGPDAGETINLFGLAIRKGLTAADLKDTVFRLFAYPTLGSDVVTWLKRGMQAGAEVRERRRG